MDGSITLSRRQRNELLDLYRTHPAPHVRHRSHVLLLLADGHAWSLIVAVLFCSTATIARWRNGFLDGGVHALLEERRGRPGMASSSWVATMLAWAHAARLRVLPQPLVLRDARAGPARDAARPRRPRDGPPAAARARAGLASPAAGARAERPASRDETAADPRAAAGSARGRGGRVRGRGRP